MNIWKILASKTIIKNKYLSVLEETCELPNGLVIDDYIVLDEPDAAVIFGVTKEKEVLLVEQYKHGVRKICVQLPGGLFNAKTDDPEQVARRELMEETGYTADEFIPLGKYINMPNRSVRHTHLFLAVDMVKVGEQDLDEQEDINVHKVPITEITNRIQSGEIQAIESIAFIYMALEKLKELNG